MKKILPFVLMSIFLCGCSKPGVQTSWEIAATPMEDNTYEVKAELQRIIRTTYALAWVKVQVEQINLPQLILKPGEQAENLIPEPDISRTMKSNASFKKSGERITFEFSVIYDQETYTTNGVITIQ